MKKFRLGKKFKQAYLDIGLTNQKISNLLIEAESFDRHNNAEEAKARRELADKFRRELVDKYDPETFDLEYTIPMSSGLYVKHK